MCIRPVKTLAWTEFHENEDLIHAVRHFVPSGVDQMHDVWVALQYPLWEDLVGND